MAMYRDEAIKRIRAALKRKTGKTWSVTGGRGTSSGWITVQAPPKRRVRHEPIGDIDDPEWLNAPYRERVREEPLREGDDPRGFYTPWAECDQLARAFKLDAVHGQGILISPDKTESYVMRAETGNATKGTPQPTPRPAPVAVTFAPPPKVPAPDPHAELGKAIRWLERLAAEVGFGALVDTMPDDCQGLNELRAATTKTA